MYDKAKKFSIEIRLEGCIYYQFSDDDFRYAEDRAEEFIAKGIFFSASIYDEGDLIETIRWDEDKEEIVYILSYSGRLKGYRVATT